MVKGETGQSWGGPRSRQAANPRKRKEKGSGETRKEAGETMRKK